ncbi:MAG: toxic anion resistance protein [Oscillospiraceae bacterium]|nr:toxic anion resistance protein [Oscillospiraceae bacterium]
MNGEYTFDEVITPSLTLEPELERAAEITPAPQPEAAEPVLTLEEQAMVAAFAEKIDVENTAQILQYGAGTQKKMADFSDAALANVRTQDLGEVGNLIADVVGELKGFDAEEKKGLLGFLRKKADQLENMKNRYAKAELNVAKIGDALQQHQVRLLKDSAVLDKMYEQNLAYFKELTMYILAGKQKLQQVRAVKLLQLEEKAKQSGLAEDAQAARDLADKANRFEKKIHDLELTRAISIQTAPQIRMIQNNNNVMVEKIQTTLMNTIPLWKNQMVLALGIAHSTEAAQAQRQVTDITNALLKQNAEKLHMASVETAKEAERGIVDIETLKATNAKLIQTFDDVLKIQAEGRAKRLAAENEMAKMENDLKIKLLEISGR